MKLSDVREPRDLKGADAVELTELASDIRSHLIQTVSATGGHLGPNLGVVELTLALHRVFDSPQDTIVFDTGHQAYVHKMLTGRADQFDTLRQPGGLSGYPDRGESPHDVVENSHASTALSWVDGIADGYGLTGQSHRHVVAVIGDGALTGGMAWEALNNIAGKRQRPLVIVVNDNGRSYAPTIGGIAHHLQTLRTTQGYEDFLAWGKRTLTRTPLIGRPVLRALHGLKRGLHDAVLPEGMFQDLGLKYIGPINGHSIADVETALTQARNFPGPVIVHCMTSKGRGYNHAEADTSDHFHGIGPINPETGLPLATGALTWTATFSEHLVTAADSRSNLVAMTAAMMVPTGLDTFAHRFPERFFDVGIAEQHAVTSAAGMAYAGLHPVFAVYASFLNRAFDQTLLDVALHKAAVTFVLDRAGITGDDGPSHHGVWDLSLLNKVPSMLMFAPRDAQTLRFSLDQSFSYEQGPSSVRFPKGAMSEDLPALQMLENGSHVLFGESEAPLVLVGIGAMAHTAVAAAKELESQGRQVMVIDPVCVKPLPSDLIAVAANAHHVIVLEDGILTGGIGESLLRRIHEVNAEVRVDVIGVPDRFIPHGKRAAILEEIGLSAQRIVALATEPHH